MSFNQGDLIRKNSISKEEKICAKCGNKSSIYNKLTKFYPSNAKKPRYLCSNCIERFGNSTWNSKMRLDEAGLWIAEKVNEEDQ